MNPKASLKQAELVVEIVADIEGAVASGMPADAALTGLYRAHREFGSRDRRFFSGIVFSYFRWKGWFPALGLTDAAERCIVAGLLDADEEHPAIRALVEQTRFRDIALSPLCSLSMDEKARRVAEWTATLKPPAVADLLPDWTPAALHTPPDTNHDDHVLRCVVSFQSRPPTWIRVRHRFQSEAERVLRAHGVPFEAHVVLRDAMCIPAGTPGLNPAAPALQGKVEIQDLASQTVGLVCAPARGSNWWDVCAGAMGKTLHLADLMDEKGRILATDIRESALSEGHRRVKNAGLSCVEWKTWDLAQDPAPGHLFDGILVDAPCSAVGTWHRNPDARWRTSIDAVREKAALQKNLLEAASRKLADGGALIYATCTLTDMENSDVVDHFLRTHPDFALVPFHHPITGERTPGSIWIWPWDGPCNGMFLARMTKRIGNQ